MLQYRSALIVLLAAVSFVPCFGQTQATFQTQTQNLNTYYFPGNSPNVFTADLNNDGIQDLIEVTTTTYPGNGFQVYLGKGDGTFTPGYSYDFSSNPGFNLSLTVGDFNGDGNADLVFVLSGSEILATFLGKGDGTFQAPMFQNLGQTFGTSASVAADYNRDGKLDLVTSTFVSANSSTITTLNVFPGVGDGTFTPSPIASYEVPTSGSPNAWLGIGDFDGDGNMDVAYELFTNCGLGSTTCQASLHVLYGSGTPYGGFTDTTPYTTTSSGMTFGAGDLNSDGTTDLFGVVGFGPQQLVVLYGASDRTMPTYTQNLNADYIFNQGNYSNAMFAMADFNGDGRMDLVGQAYTPSGGNALGVLLATSSPGAFTEQEIALPFLTSASNQTPLVGTFTSDPYGRPDILTLSTGNNNDNTNYGYATVFEALNKTNGGFWGGCAFPAKGMGINLCAPSAVSASGPLTFDASANSFGDLRKIELWVDGKKLGEQFHAWEQRAWFDLGDVTLAPGNHTATLFAADIDNRLQSLSYTFSTVNCAAPSSPGINVCSPVNGATVSSPVAATAAATVAGNIQRMELWVDYVKQYSTFGSNALSTSITLAAGSHRFDYFAVNTAGEKYQTTEFVTVK